jgi:hypothetical protein
MRVRRIVAVGLLVLVASLVWPASAQSADPPTTPVLKLQFADTSVRLNPQLHGGFRADIDILVENDGLAASRPTIAAYASLGGQVTPATSATILPSSPTDIAAFGATLLNTRVEFASANADKITIVLTVATESGVSVPPVFASLSLTHGLRTAGYEWALACAAGLAILVMLLHVTLFRREKVPDPATMKVGEAKLFRRIWRGTIFPPSSDWTFSGNWTTSVSALGAVLGTVLASTGVLTDIVPGLDTGRLLGTSILLVALLLLLPLIYTSGAKQTDVTFQPTGADKPTVVKVSGVAPPAVLLSAFVSMFVTLAELGLIGALINEASLASQAWLNGVLKIAITALLALAAVCLAIYALRTLDSLRAQLPTAPEPAAKPKRAQIRLL